MDSADKLVIEIDGRELAVINGRLAAIENDNREIHAELREIRTELRLMMAELRAMNTRIEDMKHYMSLTFGAIAVFVAAVALTPIGTAPRRYHIPFFQVHSRYELPTRLIERRASDFHWVILAPRFR